MRVLCFIPLHRGTNVCKYVKSGLPLLPKPVSTDLAKTSASSAENSVYFQLYCQYVGGGGLTFSGLGSGYCQFMSQASSLETA